MSDKKRKKKKHKTKMPHTSVIHGRSGIYTYTVRSKDGKRQNKRTCIYYDVNTQKCSNDKCHIVYCTTAHNCNCYQRKENAKRNNFRTNGLSQYDENYISLPDKASIHESNNLGIAISRNVGTPMHTEFLKSEGKRRHKTRCIYHKKKDNKESCCTIYCENAEGNEV